MLRAILFDFDGTLAHFIGDFNALLNEGFAQPGLDVSLRDAVHTEYTHQLRKDGAVTSLVALEATLEHLNLQLKADLERVNAAFVRAYCEQVALLPGAAEVLEGCSSLPLALVTNGPADMQRAAIEKVGIGHHFQTVLVSGAQEVAVRKPDARIFQLACERLGVRPEEALMVGDNLEADVRGALGAGLRAVHIGFGGEVSGVSQVANLSELKAYLGRELGSELL